MIEVGQAVSNLPQAVPIQHRQASTQKVPIRFKNPDGSARNVSASTFTFHLKETPEATAVLVTYTNGSGVDMTDAATGLIVLEIDDAPPEDAIQLGSLAYDFDEVNVTDGTVPILQGPFECKVDI